MQHNGAKTILRNSLKRLYGKRFGRLIITGLSSKRNNDGDVLWEAKCDCGNHTTISTGGLRNKRSCGCLRHEAHSKLGKIGFNDISGTLFGKALALWPTIERRNHKIVWACLCECGKIFRTRIDNLTTKLNPTESCGCLMVQRIPLPPSLTGLNSLFSRYKSIDAKSRGLSFSLTKEEFREMTSSPCFYCGASPSSGIATGTNASKLTRENATYIYNGIDRLDNSLGYELFNCVPCCRPCNFAKRTRSINEFKLWVEKVYNYFVLSNKGETNG